MTTHRQSWKLQEAIILLSYLVNTILPQATSSPGPTHPGVSPDCTSWHIVQSGDTCTEIESFYGISHSQFLTWNPDVSEDCTQNFWAGYAYCVGISRQDITASNGSASKTTTLTTTTQSQGTRPPGPTFTGTPSNCNRWHLVEANQDCDIITSLYGISREQFHEFNPVVSKDCTINFWLGYAYCIGVGPSSSILISEFTTTTPLTTTTTDFFSSTYSIRHPLSSWVIETPAPDDSWPPTMTQAGQPSFCNDWYQVQGPDTCESIWQRYRTWITLADL